MKKLICFLLIAILVVGMMAGCNRQLIDLTWSFERAIIYLPDGEKIEGAVNTWNDYEGSDMIQVVVNGNTYLTHSSNVLLISD